MADHNADTDASNMAVATQCLPVDPFTRIAVRPGQPIAQRQPQGAPKFDPNKHLSYVHPPETMTMEDLGYPNDIGVSPVAISQPFQLFSEEAVDVMREEIFKDSVLAEHNFSSNLAASQLRGYAKKHAPFAYAAWNDDKVLDIISSIAGIALVPICDYEIGHVNLCQKSEEQAKEERRAIEDEGISGCQDDLDAKPIVGWHTDSYPFVCVLMMSDCKDMVGGETAIRTADGRHIKVRGPTKGCAVIMQGLYITHQAMRARGTCERITSVTSFRPKSPFAKDDTVLRTVRPVSDLNELYRGFYTYRLQNMAERIQREQDELKKLAAGARFDIAARKKFLQELTALGERTDREIVERENVQDGVLEDLGLADAMIESD